MAVALSLLLVGLGFWMVVAGWPEQTPTQTALLDLAQLPMAGAVLVGIVEMTWTRRLWLRSPKAFASVFGPAAFALLLGLVLVVVAYRTTLRSYSGTGQLLIWVGVGLAFVYLAVDSLRREVTDPRTLLFEELDEDDTPEGADHLVGSWEDEDEDFDDEDAEVDSEDPDADSDDTATTHELDTDIH